MITKIGHISLWGLVFSFATVPLLAAQQPQQPISAVPGHSFSSFLMVLIFLMILCGCAVALKRYGPGARVRRAMGLEVIGQMPLGPRATLALVRAGESILLLGVTQVQVSLIKEMPGSSFEKVLDEGLGQVPKTNP